MKTPYDPARVTELKSRIGAAARRQPAPVGKMDVPQAVAHVSVAFEAALGDVDVPRLFMGRLVGAS
ncbi:MAG: hypothetical protein IPK33_09965 [Gemmatimonadetes bacterium]|nr:hypothetical protein [Gemmatimonadota bacterium]